MNITRVTTEPIAPGDHGLVVAARIEGDGFEERAAPLLVRFGRVAALRVVSFGTGPGVRAIFSQMPAPGAPLLIGYADEPLTETRFTFTPPADFPGA